MSNLKETTFAGGCFWGVENSFMQIDGVVETTVGYMGGRFVNPTYFDVCSGITGHAEVVNIKYDEEKVDFRKLCLFFFEIHDATTLNRQGPDIGTQYRSSIFYHDDSQKEIALSVIEEISLKNKSELKIVTEIIPVADYYIAEDYHQKYILKNNLESCGG
ncbi:MAG TPA: peptide-methionine (S)-S-oxide reductase MsrA [Candidatus Dadabacteria bacterium]|jgi:peptide-methionine (S)-S-oxide reductase|nr:peptide-methionine (S)-S-oxide reductase MsrA [Candidatus Dadabacteria bacterium]